MATNHRSRLGLIPLGILCSPKDALLVYQEQPGKAVSDNSLDDALNDPAIVTCSQRRPGPHQVSPLKCNSRLIRATRAIWMHSSLSHAVNLCVMQLPLLNISILKQTGKIHSSSGRSLASGGKLFHPASFYGGTTGIAYYLTEVAQVTGEAKY